MPRFSIRLLELHDRSAGSVQQRAALNTGGLSLPCLASSGTYSLLELALPPRTTPDIAE